MQYIVDIQGFKRPFNEFVLKELAIVPLEADAMPSVYLFEPPHSWSFLPIKYKCENKWLIQNFHGIPWDKGLVPYEEVAEVLRNVLHEASSVYMKGLEKKRWLEKFIPNPIINLEELGCPALQSMGSIHVNARCSNHSVLPLTDHCAVRNAVILKTWLINVIGKSSTNIVVGVDTVDATENSAISDCSQYAWPVNTTENPSNNIGERMGTIEISDDATISVADCSEWDY